MKVLYSELKELIPGLKASPKEVADALTVIGMMTESQEEVQYKKRKDVLFGLEVRQNRPDCLGVLGIAREVAAYFDSKVILPKLDIKYNKKPLLVSIEAKDDVKKVLAVKLDNLKFKEFIPEIQKYLEFHGVNSVSPIVDISNWAMLYTGFPNHIFDADKVAGTLNWQRSDKDQELTTLDGTILTLQKNNHLVISDALGPLVLASAVGGRRSAISSDTKSVIVEVAVYEPAKLQKDARSLNVTTEAGNRLQKHLAMAPARFAFDILIAKLLELGGGEAVSSVYEYSRKEPKQKPISMDIDAPSKYSGIDISKNKVLKTLKNLGFKTKLSGNKAICTPPDYRTDIEDAPDCVEEVIRMVGYQNIPVDEKPLLRDHGLVTPKRITLANMIRSLLASLGLDEVYTLPLTKSSHNQSANYEDWEELSTENSINEEFPAMRQSLIPGLIEQEKAFLLKNMDHIGFFEVGKVFGYRKNKYLELEKLAVLLHSDKSLSEIRSLIEKLLRSVGVSELSFKKAENPVPLANPFNYFEIASGETSLGVIYKLKPQKLTGNSRVVNTSIVEVDIDKLVRVLSDKETVSTYEVKDKLIVLDTNLELESLKELNDALRLISEKVGKNLWSTEVVDAYKAGKTTKYTIRISYLGLTDERAKALHEGIFQ